MQKKMGVLVCQGHLSEGMPIPEAKVIRLGGAGIPVSQWDLGDPRRGSSSICWGAFGRLVREVGGLANGSS